MPYEILYTSAPSGLKPGSSGYCTVKSSRGIPAPAVDILESLSGYRHVFTPGSPEAARNPVNWGHYFLRISGRTEHVLSRVSDCELDYTGRSNKLAHHMVIDASCPAGPAWLVGQPGWMIGQWDGQLEQFATVRKAPPERRAAGRCAAWEAATGDAGWGGVLAESFLADPERKMFIIYRPDQSILPLIEEAIALLPENRRWEVTFATYGAALPKTVECAWTGVVAGSPEVQQSRRFVNALRIDLTAPMPKAAGGTLVDFARTGRRQDAVLPKRQSAGPPAIPGSSHEPSRVRVSNPDEYSVTFNAEPVDDLCEVEPPSLPQRSRRSNVVVFWSVAVLVVASLIVGSGTATLIYLRQRNRAPALQPSTDALAESSSSNLVSDSAEPPAVSQGSPSKSAPDNSGADSNNGAASPSQPDKLANSLASPDTTAAERSPTNTPDRPADAGAVPEKVVEGTMASASPPPPSDSAAKPSPTNSSTPPQQKSVTTYFSVKRPHFQKNSDAPISVAFQPGAPLGGPITGGSVFVPRTRHGTKQGVSYFDSVEQRLQDGTFSVMLRSKVYADSNTQLIIEPKTSGVPTVNITIKKQFSNDGWEESLVRGAILLHTSSGESALWTFSPPAGASTKSLLLKDLVADFAIQTEASHFLKSVPTEDMLIENVTLTVNNNVVPLSDTSETEIQWNLSSLTDGLINKLTLQRGGSVEISDKGRVRFSCDPPLRDSDKRLNQEAQEVTDLLENLKLVTTGIESRHLQALRHNFKDDSNNSKLEEAVSAAKTHTQNHFNSERAKAGADGKKIDRAEEDVLSDIEKYRNKAVAFRKRKQMFAAFVDKTHIVSGVISYKVWPLQIVGSTSEAGPISASTFQKIGVWQIRAED
ncbi:hypothetical protein [Planctomyces sp. SH-PL14]|uniref:GAP1-N2 domain-containing protein n=1 Tax=Planctomyces sp. SH-PL14 TaxID=1632864 RepID=UPI00078C7D71|nr:hypothetical protein [Planctomyces sp. SH-PL14]AMV18226.1 hypothetical protein VT03_10080 [Planctomyces sp. SH-PL14]